MSFGKCTDCGNRITRDEFNAAGSGLNTGDGSPCFGCAGVRFRHLREMAIAVMKLSRFRFVGDDELCRLQELARPYVPAKEGKP